MGLQFPEISLAKKIKDPYLGVLSADVETTLDGGMSFSGPPL